MHLLALDCSTSRGGVALGDGSRTVWQTDFAAGRGRGGEMFTALQAALGRVAETGGSLTGIMVGLGPGSYSGVRQAIAAATGLAAATGASLRGVPSLAALPGGPGPFHAVGDARRGTFYYAAVQAYSCLLGPELLADAAELTSRVQTNPGWPVYSLENPLPGGLLPGAAVALPDAGFLLRAPSSSHQPPPLEPIYLRPVSITLPKTASTSVP